MKHQSKSKSSIKEADSSEDAEKTISVSEKVSSKSRSSSTSASEIHTESHVNSATQSSVSNKIRQDIDSVNTARDESFVDSVVRTASVFTEEVSHTKSSSSHITTAVDSSVNQTTRSNISDNTIPELEQVDLGNSSTGTNFFINIIFKFVIYFNFIVYI